MFHFLKVVKTQSQQQKMPNDPSVADDIGAVPMVWLLFCFCDEIATVDYASNDCFRADINNKQVNASYGRYVAETLLPRC